MNSIYVRSLLQEGYPAAPQIEDDSYEVAQWLRELMTFVKHQNIEEGCGIEDALILFEHANQETNS